MHTHTPTATFKQLITKFLLVYRVIIPLITLAGSTLTHNQEHVCVTHNPTQHPNTHTTPVQRIFFPYTPSKPPSPISIAPIALHRHRPCPGIQALQLTLCLFSRSISLTFVISSIIRRYLFTYTHTHARAHKSTHTRRVPPTHVETKQPP